MNFKLRRNPTTGWSSASERPDQQTGLDRLRAQLAITLAPAAAVIGNHRRGLSDRLLGLADLAVDATTSPAGRVVTATACLTGAWALIGA